MREGHIELTEKEKQTLRLLANGHDAKSIANHLGLSVHTINERLRDARRKLATSSSREAARLLRDQESSAPENSVPTSLGDADPGTNAPVQSDRAAARWQRPGWIIGGLIMSFAFALLAFTTFSAPEAAPQSAPAAVDAQSDKVAAARNWLALIDADNWDASWDGTGKAFKSANTRKIWADVSTMVRARFGQNQGRTFMSAQDVPAPPNGYWVIKFRARYANQADAIETVSLAREDGEWRVAGVTIE